MLLVAHESEYHAHSEGVLECKFRGKVDRNNTFETEYNLVHRPESNLRATEPDVRSHHIAVPIEPLPLALAFAIEQFQALNCSYALDECRTFLRLRVDGVLGLPPDYA